MESVGVDGCRAGWIAVYKLGGALTYRIFSTIDELVEHFPTAKCILIDIPIGLPSRGTPMRSCDSMARNVLGPRRSSVFPVPCREAVRAKTLPAARYANMQELNRSLSAQSWSICPKISEVDRLLLNRPEFQSIIREIHPEVCFWGLAGGFPMRHNKKSRDGLAERLSVLSSYEPDAETLLKQVRLNERRKAVMADDVVDALVAYVVSAVPKTRLKSFQGTPNQDEKQLSMEMLYATP